MICIFISALLSDKILQTSKFQYRKELKKILSYQTIHVRWKLELILLTSLLSFYTTLILSKSHFWKFSSSQNRNWEFMTSNPFGDSKYTWWTFCKKQLNRLTKPFKTFWQQMQKGDLHTRYLESDLKNGHCWEFWFTPKVVKQK